MNRRKTLDMATKRTKRANPKLTWQQARANALRWCVAMWPSFTETGR